MSRRRRSRLALPLRAGLALLAVAAGATGAAAQSQTSGDSSLLRPGLDGDPRTPPRFVTQKSGPPEEFQLPKYGNPPGSGAGTTGFDSTNARRKKKAKPVIETQKLAPLVVPPADATVAPVYRQPLSSRQINRLANQSAGIPVATETTGDVQRKVLRRPEEDPFGAVGISTGPFVFKPAIELSNGYDTNPGQSLAAKGSWFQQVSPEMLIASNWSRHELTAELKGSYTWFDTLSRFNRPTIDAKANARIDISSQTQGLLEARYQLRADNPGDPNIPSDVASPPIYSTYGATAGVLQKFSRFEVTLKGTFDRTAYEDGKLNDGTPVSFANLNYDQFGGQLRGAYEITPGIKPFVEGGIDTRTHDPAACLCGDKDSNGQYIKVGSTFELSRKLTGEASVGYLQREYKDPALPELRTPTFDASLIYAATPLTTATLMAKTTVGESSIAGVSGTITHDYGLQVDHSFRRWLIGTLKFGFGTDDYDGLGRFDKRYSASAALVYKLTREMQLKGEFRQNWLRSNVSGANYDESIFLLGMRFQR